MLVPLGAASQAPWVPFAPTQFSGGVESNTRRIAEAIEVWDGSTIGTESE